MPELPDMFSLPRQWEGQERTKPGGEGSAPPPTEDNAPPQAWLDRLDKQRELAAQAMADPHYADPVSQFFSKYVGPFFSRAFAAGPQPVPVDEGASEYKPLVDPGHPVTQAYQAFKIDNAYARYKALQDKYGNSPEGRTKAGADPELQQLAEEIKWGFPLNSFGYIDPSLRMGRDPGASYETPIGKFAEHLADESTLEEVQKRAAGEGEGAGETTAEGGKEEGGEPASMLEWAKKASEIQAKYPMTYEGRVAAMRDPELQLALIAGRGIVEDVATGVGGFYKSLVKAAETVGPTRRALGMVRAINKASNKVPGQEPAFDHFTYRSAPDAELPATGKPDGLAFSVNPTPSEMELLQGYDKALGGAGEVSGVRDRVTGDVHAWPASQGEHGEMVQEITGRTMEPRLTTPEALPGEAAAPELPQPSEEQLLGGYARENSGGAGPDRLTDAPLHEQRVATFHTPYRALLMGGRRAGDPPRTEDVQATPSLPAEDVQAEVMRQKMAADRAGISPQGAAAIAIQHPDDVDATYAELRRQNDKEEPFSFTGMEEKAGRPPSLAGAAMDVLTSIAQTPVAMLGALATMPKTVWDSYSWLREHPYAAWSDGPDRSTAYQHALNVAGALNLSEAMGVSQVEGSTILGAGAVRKRGAGQGVTPSLPSAESESGATGKAITAVDLRALPYPVALEVAKTERHVIPGQEGQYVGAPRGMDSTRKLGSMRRDYDAAVDQGVVGSKWYGVARGAINDVAGMDPARQSLLARQWALFSSQATVDTNLGFQLQAHNAWLAGHPLEIAHTGRQASTFNAAMDTGAKIPLQQKTDVFANTLDPTRPMPSTGTNDIWQGRAFGYAQESESGGFSPQEHAFMDAETVLATDRANKRGAGGRSDWTPGEVQAAAWVAAKGRSDGLNFYESNKNIDPRTGKKVATKEEAIKKGIKDAARTFPDFFPKYTAYVTEESVPYAASGHMKGLEAAPEEVRQKYTDAVSWRDEQGRDRLAADLGMFVRSSTKAVGIYHPPGGAVTEFNPAVPARPMVGFAGPSGNREVDPNSAALLDSIGAIKGYMGVQGAVPWHLARAQNSMKNSAGYRIPMNRMASHDELAQLDDLLGPKGLMPIPTGDGITIMPREWGDPAPITQALKTGLADQIKQVLPDAKGAFRAGISGGYPSFEDELLAERRGSGRATDKMLKILEANPKIFEAGRQIAGRP
jgi:hypothetical protein